MDWIGEHVRRLMEQREAALADLAFGLVAEGLASGGCVAIATAGRVPSKIATREEMDMKRGRGQEPDPEITAFERLFEPDEVVVSRDKTHSGTWAETFETLGCGLIIALIVLGAFALCGLGLWFAGHRG